MANITVFLIRMFQKIVDDNDVMEKPNMLIFMQIKLESCPLF